MNFLGLSTPFAKISINHWCRSLYGGQIARENQYIPARAVLHCRHWVFLRRTSRQRWVKVRHAIRAPAWQSVLDCMSLRSTHGKAGAQL